MPIVVSGFGTGGGLFRLDDDDQVTRIDALPTVGIATCPGGAQLARLLQGATGHDAPAHVLLYDRAGLRTYQRVAALADPHGITWPEPDRILAIGTAANAVVELDSNGTPRAERRFAEAPDAWHLNCPTTDAAGVAYATAFVTGSSPSGWRAATRDRAGSGVVVDLADGRVCCTGLNAPHDPLPLDNGAWLVNSSADHELRRVEADGAVSWRAELGAWTRGLLLVNDGQRALVGLSGHRDGTTTDRSAVVELDLRDQAIVRRWEVPCEEVFQIVAMDDQLISAVRHAFAPLRALAGTEAPSAGAVLDAPLGPDALRISIRQLVATEATAAPGTTLQLRLLVRNEGTATISSLGSHPVRIGGRWVEAGAGLWPDEPRATLVGPLAPGASAELRLVTTAPSEPGQYVLRVGAVQEGVAWADDLHPELGLRIVLEVSS